MNKRKPLAPPSWLQKYGLLYLGLFLVGTVSLAAIFAPLLTPYDPFVLNVNQLLLPPGPNHFFGTDALGRDVFARMLYGGGFHSG